MRSDLRVVAVPSGSGDLIAAGGDRVGGNAGAEEAAGASG